MPTVKSKGKTLPNDNKENTTNHQQVPKKRDKTVFTYMESICEHTNFKTVSPFFFANLFRINAFSLKTKIDKSSGPMSLLYRSIKDNRRIKVWTRSHTYVRSICSGYLVAFDQYWNLVSIFIGANNE